MKENQNKTTRALIIFLQASIPESYEL